jgi:hypothetical protein
VPFAWGLSEMITVPTAGMPTVNDGDALSETITACGDSSCGFGSGVTVMTAEFTPNGSVTDPVRGTYQSPAPPIPRRCN